jgi:hypothetical protein
MNIADPQTYIEDEAERLFDELLNDINSEFSASAISQIFFIEGILDLEKKIEEQYKKNVELINLQSNMFSRDILIAIQSLLKQKYLKYLSDQKKFFVGGGRVGDPSGGVFRPIPNRYSFPVASTTSFPSVESFDDLIDNMINELTEDTNQTYTFKRFSIVKDKSAVIKKNRTVSIWNCDDDALNTFFTGSNGLNRDKYYLSVYNENPNNYSANPQFDISFGHIAGSGSSLLSGEIDLMPSKTMYRKYMMECVGDVRNDNDRFPFKNGVNGDYVYIIQLDRDLLKDRLDAGNFELFLTPLSGSSNQLINTGSNVQVSQTSTELFSLIDDSGDSKQSTSDREDILEVYNLVSGSKRDGVYADEDANAWGLVYPKLGVIILDGTVLDQSCSFNTVTASIDGDNISKLFLSLSGSASVTNVRSYSGSFFARSNEKVMTQTYFCRVNTDEYNYSCNPSYVTGSRNELRFAYFQENPQSYITSIGLYNSKNELLAIGKLKKPILKNNNKSYIFEVKMRMN